MQTTLSAPRPTSREQAEPQLLLSLRAFSVSLDSLSRRTAGRVLATHPLFLEADEALILCVQVLRLIGHQCPELCGCGAGPQQAEESKWGWHGGGLSLLLFHIITLLLRKVHKHLWMGGRGHR